MLKLFQVFYREDHFLDNGCIPFDARGIDVYPLYENKHILGLHKDGLSGADYYGVTSFRMFEKTGLYKKNIDDFIEDNPGYDVYLYGNQGGAEMLRNNVDPKSEASITPTAIGLCWIRLAEIGLLKNPSLIYEDWVNCFCNFWIASEPVWDRYMIYLQNTAHMLRNDSVLQWMTKNAKLKFRGKSYPIDCFVLEYLFGLFLKDNPDIKYIDIPNKFTPDSRNRKSIKNDTRSLMEVYQNHKSDISGQGDKGTLHAYIEEYDKLLSPYRRKDVNVLEIGVAGGYSMRLWREYFTRARLIGIDIVRPDFPTTGWWFKQANQASKQELDAVLKEETLDVIIDDGSHVLDHQLASFIALYPRLNPGGIYIIEDIGGVSRDPDKDMKILQENLGPCEVIDLRYKTGRYDDILMIWRK